MPESKRSLAAHVEKLTGKLYKRYPAMTARGTVWFEMAAGPAVFSY